MKQHKRHRLWIASVTILALVSFLAGTSLACFHKGTGTVAMAEDCCQSHCQHEMTGEAATDCCQSHHAQVSQALPLSPPTKTLISLAVLLSTTLLPPAVLQGQAPSWVPSCRAEHPPSSPSLYTLHCILLI